MLASRLEVAASFAVRIMVVDERKEYGSGQFSLFRVIALGSFSSLTSLVK